MLNNHELEPSVEVIHLRRLLDIQPVCLMRLGADGTVLAANDAALAMLGATSGAQLLGQDFSHWIAPEQRERWRAFAAEVNQRRAASVECEIRTPSGDLHPTLFHAVPLTDHPDGVASMAVSARAVARQHQLENAIVELEERLRERDAERLEARTRLAEAEGNRRQFAENVDALEARLRAREATSSEAERQLRAEHEARSEALAASDAARRAAEANCARALSEVQQLQMALEDFSARQLQLTAERESARQMSQSAAARHEQELADARTRLAEAEGNRRQLAENVDALEASLRAREATSSEAERQLRAELEARSEALAASDAARRAAEANCARALSEVQQLQMALEDFAARQLQLTAELASERESARQMSQSATARHEHELADARRAPEWEQLTATLEEREAAVRELEAARSAAQAELDKALASCREREASLRQLETAHAELVAAHAAVTEEHDTLVNTLREHAVRLEALANGAPRARAGSAAAEGLASSRAGWEEERA